MRCDEVVGQLDGYAEGSLEPDVAARVDDHLAGCSQCASELEGQRRLLARVADLPREVEPSRDLWPALASRLSLPPTVVEGHFGGSRRWRLAAVAAAMLIAAGSLLIAYSLGRQHVSGPMTARGQLESSVAVPARVAGTGIAEAEAEFVEARDQLLAALAARRGTMSAETQRVVDDNLKLIDGAIVRITVALADDPWNPRLANRLARAYRTQIELLQRANALPAEI
jgi:anti-sigma factor RsiW